MWQYYTFWIKKNKIDIVISNIFVPLPKKLLFGCLVVWLIALDYNAVLLSCCFVILLFSYLVDTIRLH